STLAVPIMTGDRVLATLGMTYFTSAMKRAQAVELYVPHLRAAAENIGRSIARLGADGHAGAAIP
ncbi:hypothetical protein ABTM10_19225, partial [Acinetobacter baumannii]